MNIKFLKKVRKRFSIVHCPNGVYIGTDYMPGNMYALYDKEDCFGYRTRYAYLKENPNPKGTREFTSERECINSLKDIIISRLRDDYPSNAHRRRVNSTHKTVWYK